MNTQLQAIYDVFVLTPPVYSDDAVLLDDLLNESLGALFSIDSPGKLTALYMDLNMRPKYTGCDPQALFMDLTLNRLLMELDRVVFEGF